MQKSVAACRLMFSTTILFAPEMYSVSKSLFRKYYGSPTVNYLLYKVKPKYRGQKKCPTLLIFGACPTNSYLSISPLQLSCLIGANRLLVEGLAPLDTYGKKMSPVEEYQQMCQNVETAFANGDFKSWAQLKYRFRKFQEDIDTRLKYEFSLNNKPVDYLDEVEPEAYAKVEVNGKGTVFWDHYGVLDDAEYQRYVNHIDTFGNTIVSSPSVSEMVATATQENMENNMLKARQTIYQDLVLKRNMFWSPVLKDKLNEDTDDITAVCVGVPHVKNLLSLLDSPCVDIVKVESE